MTKKCHTDSKRKLYTPSSSPRIRARSSGYMPKIFLIMALIFSQSFGLAYHHRFPAVMRRRLLSKNVNAFHSRKSTRTTVSSRMTASDDDDKEKIGDSDQFAQLEKKYIKRIIRLEELVAKQEVEIHRLKKTCNELSETSDAFARVINLLREAGLEGGLDDRKEKTEISDKNIPKEEQGDGTRKRIVESYDESMIFGTAPSSVIDAADAAGAAILAAMLGGKRRMLVDVRDAELSTDPETLVQFIELAILPVAAGLEGLESPRNRVKIVFPKVSQLLEYRRTMALAAPEVVALSTLGFDPVEERDQLVVIVAPEPDDEEGLAAISVLLSPADGDGKGIQQPVVLLNYHMVPVTGLPPDFETAYHLRLLRVQFMSGGNANEYFQQFQKDAERLQKEAPEDAIEHQSSEEDVDVDVDVNVDVDEEDVKLEDEELEAAMKHAHEVGMNQGTTRAMVIRAYPRPWHLFVDISPSTDSDYEVAGTFVEEPTMDELNLAIVECLEGSEREDEIVASQMQQALEEGHLDEFEKYSEEDTEMAKEEDDDFDTFDEDESA